MSIKTSKIGVHSIALKCKLIASSMINQGPADNARSLTGDKVLTANKEIVEENGKSNAKKSLLSEIGDKLCLSMWSAYK